jgi:signal transduction histidine kinase
MTGFCPKNVILKISDTGVGIDKDRFHSLFIDYQTTKRKGLGLSIAITKRFLVEVGGTVIANSLYSTLYTILSLGPARPASDGRRDVWWVHQILEIIKINKG